MTHEEDRHIIDRLARDLQARVVYDVEPNHSGGYTGPRADHAGRTIHLVRDGGTDMDYWVALHELGHIAQSRGRSFFDTPEAILADEVSAWTWAIRKSPKPVDRAAVAGLTIGLGSYTGDLLPWTRLDAPGLVDLARLVTDQPLSEQELRRELPGMDESLYQVIRAGVIHLRQLVDETDLANAA